MPHEEPKVCAEIYVKRLARGTPFYTGVRSSAFLSAEMSVCMYAICLVAIRSNATIANVLFLSESCVAAYACVLLRFLACSFTAVDLRAFSDVACSFTAANIARLTLVSSPACQHAFLHPPNWQILGPRAAPEPQDVADQY